MNRLDFICNQWAADEAAPPGSTARMKLPDFKGNDKDCWHLRGRGWKWVVLRCFYPKASVGEEYELFFWGKIDFYSKYGAKLYIDLCESGHWSEHKSYPITPACPNAVVSAGDWVLYKFSFKAVRGSELMAQIISFQANIAITEAYPSDELDSSVISAAHDNSNEPFSIDMELPFKEYASLEQRVVKFYSDMLAPFYPCKDISEVSQRDYYAFVKELYERLFAMPERFFSKLYDDDAHPNRFNNADYGKPDLKRHMRSDQSKIEELFEVLLNLGKSGEITDGTLQIKLSISKKQLHLLTYMGFEVEEGRLGHGKYPMIGAAISYLAGKEKSLWSLMYCWFDDTFPYLEKTYAKHYDTGQYTGLINWLRDNGYKTSIGTCSGLTLDYYKSISKEDKPVGYALHGDKFNYGFTFEFRVEPRVMQHCEPRIIQYAKMLNHYDDLSGNTKKLILQRTKRCDGCRYCNQTDKTGKRPLAAIKLTNGLSLCPYYPGFTYTFERLLKQDVESITDFLTDLEKLVLSNND